MADDGITHVDRALPTSGHRQMYNSHKYFARKQADVVSEYVEGYTTAGDVVLDPFCGSGVHVAEAVGNDRRAVGFDVNPFAVFLARNTVRYVDPGRVEETFDRIAADVAPAIESLYRTRCRDCGADLSAICYTWDGDDLADVRYDCPCRDDRSIEDATERDRARYAAVEAGEPDAFFDGEGRCRHPYPTDGLAYPDGSPFVERQGYESVDDLFTARNLVALAKLRDRIEAVADDRLRGAFEHAFSSMLHLASAMTPVRPSRPFSSAWTQHSYWSADRFMEQNVWTLFERATLGRQSLLKAKRDQPTAFADKREAGSVGDVLGGEGDYHLRAADAVDALSAMPDDSVDYVITDPPYGGSIQYGELLYMWNAWTRSTDGVAAVSRDEIVVNSQQGKDEATYERMLSAAFEAVYDVLKPGRYCTVTFHNPKLRYRAALFRAVVGAGFAFETVVYQPPPRPSAKGLLQPFGSLKGDYFFRFRKPERPLGADRAETRSVDRRRVEQVVVETAEAIVEARGEPTHYTFIQNAIDPALYSALREHGLLMEFDPEDVEEILRDHVGDVFRLVEMEVAERNGEPVLGTGWWFADPSDHATGASLRKRVEATVTSILRRERTVAFEDVLDEVYATFADSLTPERRTVEDVLAENATEEGRGTWRVDPFVDDLWTGRERAVDALVAAADRAGYEVDVAAVDPGNGADGRTDRATPAGAAPAGRPDRVDVVWRDGDDPVAAFDAERSTAVVDAVVRGADFPHSVPRFLVVPEPREDAVRRRFDQPAVRGMVGDAEWRVVTDDAVAGLAESAPGTEVTLDAVRSLASDALSDGPRRPSGDEG